MLVTAMRRFELLLRCSVLATLALAVATALPAPPPPSRLPPNALWPPESPQQQTLTLGNANDPPTIEVVFPAPHSWWQVNDTTGRLDNLPVHFKLHGFQTPEDGFVRVIGDKVLAGRAGQTGAFIVDGSASSFVMNGVEPGSYFFTLQLVRYHRIFESQDGDELLDGDRVVASTTLHLEVVVPATTSPMFAYTPVNPHSPPPLRQVTLHPRLERATKANSRPPPLPICYILTTRSGFDGQKKMWLQLMEALSSPEKSAGMMRSSDSFARYPGWSPAFRVEAITFDTIVPDSPVLHALNKLGIPLNGGEQKISINDLRQANVTEADMETTIMERFYDEFPEANPLPRGSDSHRRLSIQDQSRLANLKPAFVQNAWRTMVDQLQACAGGVVVMSNSRFATDELIVNAARLAGARAVVMELANLFPSLLEVDALFAPSHFALRHPSVVSNLSADKKFVVSTGVNTDVFAPLPADLKLRHPLVDDNVSSFVVGVVGRLNTDKCVGVLIETARALRVVCSFCKLRLIGDGTLKVHLKALAQEWGLLDSTVEFVDGVFNDEAALAAELHKMHVYAAVAPETLGIAVLEAMSTGVPVVGFIYAGTSEFLVDGYNCVGVRECSAEAVSDAIMTLVRDSKLWEEVGRNARKTVEMQFSRDESIREIAMLYQSLARD